MKTTGVYQIQSKIKPERIYIGSAINIACRWTIHLWYLRKNIHHSAKLQRHYNKYGKNDLIFSILIGCDKQDLLVTEQFFLDFYKPYFNNCLTAGSRLGTKTSEETKIKMRQHKRTDEWKKAMSQRQIGHSVSEETRRKISEKHKNKNNRINYHHSEETKQKMRHKHKQYILKKVI